MCSTFHFINWGRMCIFCEGFAILQNSVIFILEIYIYGSYDDLFTSVVRGRRTDYPLSHMPQPKDIYAMKANWR